MASLNVPIALLIKDLEHDDISSKCHLALEMASDIGVLAIIFLRAIALRLAFDKTPDIGIEGNQAQRILLKRIVIFFP